ncbi:MAG: DUF2779 domain-containing protein [Anaerolineales bacterium]|nr:DUF2779 domain-containing protein [Anaerolineales bacterium]
MLTKTAFLAYVQCPKQVWLDAFQPEIAAAPDPAALRRLQMGQAVDQLARTWFVDGRSVPYRPHPEDMAPLTREAMEAGAETLFQATFHVDDLLVKVDILTKTAAGWHLIEVKSSTQFKEAEHLWDVAFQVYVLRQAGVSVVQASLMHLNSDCVAPDLGNLFVLTDVTEVVEAVLPQVAADTAVMRQLLGQVESPQAPIGRHCKRPYDCAFYGHCWQGVHGLTIYDIPRLSAQKERPLQEAGVLYLQDIPADAALTAKQAAFVDFHMQSQLVIDRAAIHQALADLQYPLYFFDFETIDQAIPTLAGCKPYQQVPFQYSCHVLDEAGGLTHLDYLHTDQTDPRRPLAEALLSHIGETGSLIAYNIPFERGVLRHLAEVLPEHADRLLGMADRLWDQLPIFRNHYRDYRFGTSNSLKSVLPVIAPQLSYAALDVQNGTQAQVVWEAMLVEGDTAVQQQMIQQLRDYCHLDTLAMVEIHHALVNL